MDLTDAYENGKYIPGAENYPPRWQAAASAFRAAQGKRARLGLVYGGHERQRFDLFLPGDVPVGLVVFVHGGYWVKFDRSFWSHLASGALARGWAVAMPSYRLAPEVRISDITQDVAAAVAAAAGEVAGPVVVAGHSAGGHLSARIRCRDVGLPQDVAARIVRVLPISPLSDLAPLMQTAMNADLRIDFEEVMAESPMRHSDLLEADTVVWVGAEERPAFLDQARWLAGAWPQTVARISPGRHHFDVIEDLAAAHSPLTGALLGGLA
ncbi:MAG: alpha/beta hydrolase [Rhodobacteraceae bacterium]|nr:alpha/beta hydrolase [Paracoccaceae bacterium]